MLLTPEQLKVDVEARLERVTRGANEAKAVFSARYCLARMLRQGAVWLERPYAPNDWPAQPRRKLE